MGRIIALDNRKILCREDEEGRILLPEKSEISILSQAEIFETGDDYAISSRYINDIPPCYDWKNLREILAKVSATDYSLITKGAQLVDWNEAQRYCPADGCILKRKTNISKQCECCGKEYFPILSPAIVVLVKKGDKALLVHSKSLKPGIHALVAGFVECGETPEECVKREVKEETNLEIGNIKYIGSQSWPFPNQLMIGFTAEYVSGELKHNDIELDDSDFFTRQNPPELPLPPSLTRKIIDMWIRGEI